jgi:hypothetical protein
MAKSIGESMVIGDVASSAWKKMDTGVSQTISADGLWPVFLKSADTEPNIWHEYLS